MKLLLSASPSERQFHPELARQFLEQQFAEQRAALIIVPTATMADHYRHTLARTGFALRPQSIQTLAQFLDAHSPTAAAPIPLVHHLLSRAMERQKPYPFRSIAQDPGLLGGLTRLFAEASAERLRKAAADLPRKASASTALVNAVVSLFREVEVELEARGMAARHARLHAAAERMQDAGVRLPRQILIDGFAKFSEGEVALILSLASRVMETQTLAVALPKWFGADNTRGKLLAAGFDEPAATASKAKVSATVVVALNIEREVEEIARRILAHAEKGRPFREIGIVLRAREPYGPLLETTLARFGIPSRSYFTDPAARHPAIQYLSSVMQALLSNWDLEPLLSALRMPVSGVGATPMGDEFDFALRGRLPGSELPSGEHYFSQPVSEQRLNSKPRGKRKPSERLLARDASLPQDVLNQMAALSALRSERLEPAAWAKRLQSLCALIPAPVVEDRASLDQVQTWRSTAVALRTFRDALESAADALTPAQRATGARCDLTTFWNQVATTLSLEPLRVPDPRRNVVHVMDAYEARQWDLPIVFVCGMTERHFPQYHSEHPIVGDDVLRRAGLDTAADHEREEQFLFEVARTRATVETVLSYPKFNDAGDPTLPSFFLQNIEAAAEDCTIQVRPASVAATCDVHSHAANVITDASLLETLATAHKTLSASSIERYLQCPFQFFAEKTLRLRERPPAPRDRLDLLLQGNIIHRALAELSQRPLLGAAILDQIFDEECARAHVPEGYRTEAVRLELRRHFEAFLENEAMQGFTSRQVERDFEAKLTDRLSIRGRIDRLDIDDQQRALVIDYKYSAGAKIRERMHQSEEGSMVQAGLYMLAAREALQLEPIGMLFCGVKKGVTWDGWRLHIEGIEVGGKCDAQHLEGMMQQARDQALRVHEGVLAGRIAPQPADKDKCRWCDLQDICRIETSQAPKRAAVGDVR